MDLEVRCACACRLLADVRRGSHSSWNFAVAGIDKDPGRMLPWADGPPPGSMCASDSLFNARTHMWGQFLCRLETRVSIRQMAAVGCRRAPRLVSGAFLWQCSDPHNTDSESRRCGIIFCSGLFKLAYSHRAITITMRCCSGSTQACSESVCHRVLSPHIVQACQPPGLCPRYAPGLSVNVAIWKHPCCVAW